MPKREVKVPVEVFEGWPQPIIEDCFVIDDGASLFIKRKGKKIPFQGVLACWGVRNEAFNRIDELSGKTIVEARYRGWITRDGEDWVAVDNVQANSLMSINALCEVELHNLLDYHINLDHGLAPYINKDVYIGLSKGKITGSKQGYLSIVLNSDSYPTTHSVINDDVYIPRDGEDPLKLLEEMLDQFRFILDLLEIDDELASEAIIPLFDYIKSKGFCQEIYKNRVRSIRLSHHDESTDTYYIKAERTTCGFSDLVCKMLEKVKVGKFAII